MAMSRHPYPVRPRPCSTTALPAPPTRSSTTPGGPAWDADGFARLVDAARARLAPDTARVLERVAQILAEAHDVELRLASASRGSRHCAAALADMRAQFAGLIYPGFIAATGAARLPDLVRYLRGHRAGDWTSSAASWPGTPSGWPRSTGSPPNTRRRAGNCRAADRSRADVVAIRWLIEELRVSLFAQVLGTPAPVSEKRILTALTALTP